VLQRSWLVYVFEISEILEDIRRKLSKRREEIIKVVVIENPVFIFFRLYVYIFNVSEGKKPFLDDGSFLSGIFI